MVCVAKVSHHPGVLGARWQGGVFLGPVCLPISPSVLLCAPCELRTRFRLISFGLSIRLFDLAPSLRPDLSEGQRRRAQARSRLAAGHRRRRRGAAL